MANGAGFSRQLLNLSSNYETPRTSSLNCQFKFAWILKELVISISFNVLYTQKSSSVLKYLNYNLQTETY